MGLHNKKILSTLLWIPSSRFKTTTHLTGQCVPLVWGVAEPESHISSILSIKLVRQLTSSNNAVHIAAPPGAVAYNVQGSILHSLLKIGVTHPGNGLTTRAKENWNSSYNASSSLSSIGPWVTSQELLPPSFWQMGILCLKPKGLNSRGNTWETHISSILSSDWYDNLQVATILCKL